MCIRDRDPRDTYADVAEWETKAKDLASRFVKNFVKQKTAYEISECDWSSDVCSSDLPADRIPGSRRRSFLAKYNPATGISERLTFGNHSTYLRCV